MKFSYCTSFSRRFREGFKRCLTCDRKSVNRKSGSVITATSSINGSIHKQSSRKSATASRRTSLKMEPVAEGNEVPVKLGRQLSEISVISDEASVLYDHEEKDELQTTAKTNDDNTHVISPTDIEPTLQNDCALNDEKKSDGYLSDQTEEINEKSVINGGEFSKEILGYLNSVMVDDEQDNAYQSHA